MGRGPDKKIVEGDTILIHPSLDLLLKKVDSKYTLVILTSRRAREVVAGERSHRCKQIKQSSHNRSGRDRPG